jgi:toxin ParE1/3/4
MKKCIFSSEAIADLNSIWTYTAEEWSVAQANKYYRMLVSACNDIISAKRISHTYNEIYEGLFGLRIGRHIIFYIYKEDGNILIVRILHEAMDFKRHFN